MVFKDFWHDIDLCCLLSAQDSPFSWKYPTGRRAYIMLVYYIHIMKIEVNDG